MPSLLRRLAWATAMTINRSLIWIWPVVLSSTTPWDESMMLLTRWLAWFFLMLSIPQRFIWVRPVLSRTERLILWVAHMPFFSISTWPISWVWSCSVVAWMSITNFFTPRPFVLMRAMLVFLATLGVAWIWLPSSFPRALPVPTTRQASLMPSYSGAGPRSVSNATSRASGMGIVLSFTPT